MNYSYSSSWPPQLQIPDRLNLPRNAYVKPTLMIHQRMSSVNRHRLQQLRAFLSSRPQKKDKCRACLHLSSRRRIRETDSDDPSENELSQPTSSAATPRFLVISSTEERQMSSLSPFVIEKTLHGMAGVPGSVKRLRSGDLLVEYVNKKHIENLLRTKKFFDLAVKVSLHSSLNTCKGVVRCPDLRGCSEQEILENMR